MHIEMKSIYILFLVFLCGRKCASSSGKGEKLFSSIEDLNFSLNGNLIRAGEASVKRDILSIMFSENVLKHMETDFLVRLYDSEMKGHVILPGRKREIESVLSEKSLDLLYYAYENRYEHSLSLIIGTISSQNFKKIISYIKYLDFKFYDHLEVCRFKMENGIDDGLESDEEFKIIEESLWCEEDRPFISLEIFKSLSNEFRLPAFIRYTVNMPISDEQVYSRFIKKFVLNRLELGEIFALYEMEMMDIFHMHDKEAVIETHLKNVILFQGNESMAIWTRELFNQGHDKALKLIIDRKFSYESPFSNAWWFQDLFWLFNYAKDNGFPKDFYSKVLSLAEPSAVRRYVSKAGSTIPDTKPNLQEFQANDEDNEDIQTIDFRGVN